MPAGNSSEQGNAVGRHLLAKLHPLSRGHPQQIGDTPDDVVLEFIHSTVSVHNFPHHLNEPATTFIVHKLIELIGEMVGPMPPAPPRLFTRLSPPFRAAIERQMAFAHVQDNWLTKL